MESEGVGDAGRRMPRYYLVVGKAYLPPLNRDRLAVVRTDDLFIFA